MSATPHETPEAEEVEALGELIALVDDYDRCHARVREYDALPEEDKHDFSNPFGDREDVAYWNRKAAAVLAAGYRKADPARDAEDEPFNGAPAEMFGIAESVDSDERYARTLAQIEEAERG